MSVLWYGRSSQPLSRSPFTVHASWTHILVDRTASRLVLAFGSMQRKNGTGACHGLCAEGTHPPFHPRIYRNTSTAAQSLYVRVAFYSKQYGIDRSVPQCTLLELVTYIRSSTISTGWTPAQKGTKKHIKKNAIIIAVDYVYARTALRLRQRYYTATSRFKIRSRGRHLSSPYVDEHVVVRRSADPHVVVKVERRQLRLRNITSNSAAFPGHNRKSTKDESTTEFAEKTRGGEKGGR